MNIRRKNNYVILAVLMIILPTFVAACPPTPLASIGDRVWEDLNEDGVQDCGEPGIPGVTVKLYDCNDPVATATTDAYGMYRFTDLVPGNYNVKFTLADGMVFSPMDAGMDDAIDSDANPTTRMTVCTTLDDGEDDMTWDAGMYVMPPPPSPGTGTPGYWKNHPEAWPVDEIIIGGETYPMDDAIGYMTTPGKGDKTFTMFRALVSAKLNVHIGNDASCIADTIGDADDWMAEHPVGSGVRASSDAWKEGEQLSETLDAYNNGLLCAPPRD